jgi:colanic acid biosynthesis glycosyl transferase WcaI
MPHRIPMPSPGVTGVGLGTLVDVAPAPPRPSLGHALVVDLDHAPDPGDQAPCSTVLAEHLARRADTVDVLGAAAPVSRRPELVVGFTPHLASAEAAAEIARTAGARLIVVVQELRRAPEAGASGSRARTHAAVRQREEHVLRDADMVAIPSETFRDAVLGHGVAGERIAVLPDWAHVVPTWLDRLDARRALGWPERGFIAVHTGMGPHHDPDLVVEAARRAGPDVRVALVGEGTRRLGTQSRAADVAHVLVTGALDGDLRPLSLVAADVLVISESSAPDELVFPGELGNCLAAARPVVVAACPGGVAHTELARAAGAGLAVPAGAPDQLAEALLTLRADPARRVAMGLAGLAHAEGHLSMRRALARFDAIVDAALEGPPAGRH